MSTSVPESLSFWVAHAWYMSTALRMGSSLINHYYVCLQNGDLKEARYLVIFRLFPITAELC